MPTRITSDELSTTEPCIAADGLGGAHVVWRERGRNRDATVEHVDIISKRFGVDKVMTECVNFQVELSKVI